MTAFMLDSSFHAQKIGRDCKMQLRRDAICRLLAQGRTDTGQIIHTVDVADEVEGVQFTNLLTVDVRCPVADSVLTGARGGRCGGNGAALGRFGHDHENMLFLPCLDRARNRILILVCHTQVNVVTAQLRQLDGLRRGGAEFQTKGHSLQMAQNDRFDVTTDTSARNALRQKGNVRQGNFRHTQILHAVLIDREVDNALIDCHCSASFLGLECAGHIVSVIFQHKINFLRRRGRGHVDVQLDFARHQAGQRVLVFQHFHTGTQQIACAHQTVQPDVGAIQNGVDETTVHRLVELAPERLDEGVGDVVEHTAERDEVVLHVSGLGVAASVVAPCGPAAHEVQERADAGSIDHVCLIVGQVDGCTVIIAQTVDMDGLVGGALVRDSAIVGVGLREAARHEGGAVELQIAQSTVRPAQNRLLVVSASVLGLHCGSIGLCGNIHQSLAREHTVDGTRLCSQRSSNGSLLGEAGCHNQVRHNAEHGQASLDLLHGSCHSLCLGVFCERQENDRLAGTQLEVIVHHLANGELCPVVVITQLFLRFGVAGAQHRGASGCSGASCLGQRCRTDDKGDAAGCGVRGRHGGVGAADVNTMICHSM
nr:MAG TPA: hypothetical protein [Caudoviricetes sp.]